MDLRAILCIFNKGKSLITLLLLALTFCVSGYFSLTPVSALSLPQTFGYQGYITNISGTSQTGNATATIRIYDKEIGGALLFVEVHTGVVLSNGYFSIGIGSVGDVDVTTSAVAISDLTFSSPYFITIELNNASIATGEMTQAGGLRSKLNAVPYAVTAYGVVATSSPSGLVTKAGNIYFNTTDEKLYVNNGSTWSTINTTSATSSLNGVTDIAQFLVASSTGAFDITFSTSSNTHTLIIPDAGALTRGVVSTTTQTFSGDKTFTGATTLATTTASLFVADNSSTTNSTSTNLYSKSAEFVSLSATSAMVINSTSSTGFFSSLLTAFSGVFTTLTGGSITATSSLTSNGSLTVLGQTSLGNASTSNLTTGNLNATGVVSLATTTVSLLSASSSVFDNASTTSFFAKYASTTNSTSTNLFTSSFFGAGLLTPCGVGMKLLWSNGTFSCDTDLVGVGGGLAFLNGSASSTQTFATTSNNNLNLTITTNGAGEHMFTLGVNSGYAIPSVASSSDWNTAFNDIHRNFTLGSYLSWSNNILNGYFATTTINGFATTSFTFATSSANNLELSLTESNGTFTLTPRLSAGYSVPLTSSSTEWHQFTTSPVTHLTKGDNILLTGTSTIAVSLSPVFTSLTISDTSSLGNATATSFATGNLNATGVVSLATTTIFNLSLVGKLYDSTSASGTLNQVLISTGTSTRWVATSTLGFGGGSGVTGGTSGFLARFTDATTLAPSLFHDNGTVTGINATSSSVTFNVQGNPGSVTPFNVASSSGSSLFTVLANGNVGIGTTTSEQKLSVAGVIYADDLITKGPYVDVRAYGAKCDGSADDSSAFQLAIDTGKNVYVPHFSNVCIVGNLVIDGSNQVLYSDGATLSPKVGALKFITLSGYANEIKGFSVNDNGNLVAKTVITSGGTIGSTVINISSTSGISVGQRYSVMLDNGSWATGWVSAVGGSSVTLSDELPSSASNGNVFWSTFGIIHVTNAIYWNVSNLVLNNVWGGIVLDDQFPSSHGGVSQGVIDNIKIVGGRMFALVKGRNTSVVTMSKITSMGGYYKTLSATGDGVETSFTLGDPVYLKRELTVKVNAITKTIGTDYTIASDGKSVTFITPPLNLAVISFGYQVYGHDGYVEDGRNSSVATGGNNLNHSNFLQYERCGNMIGAQLYNLDSVVFDGCSKQALLLDATSQIGQMNNVFVGWSTIGLHLKNAAVGAKMTGVTGTVIPSSYPVSGVEGIQTLLESGSSITGRILEESGGWSEYSGQKIGMQMSSSGKISIGSTSPSTMLDIIDNANTNGYQESHVIKVTNSLLGDLFSRLSFGQHSANNMFIESANQSNVKGNILLQPFGGYVGIGTTTPLHTLSVDGSLGVSGQTILNNLLLNGTTTLNQTNLEMGRLNGVRNGISWYSSSYFSWSDYMANASDVSTGPHGNLTAPIGAIVTAWAKRSYVDNYSGNGWTFESAANTSLPSVVAEISSNDGTIRSTGSIIGSSGINTGSGSGTQRIDGSGNLVNIGSISSGLINGQTISSSANFTGSVAVNGNLGVGLASPNQKLEILGTSLATTTSQNNISAFTGNGMRISGSIGGYSQDALTYQSGGGGGASAIAFGRGSGWDTFMSFYTNTSSNASTGGTSEKMRLDSNGNLGIGTTLFGTNARGVLGISSASVPSSGLSNLAQLYTELGELKVMNQNGIVTLLSATATTNISGAMSFIDKKAVNNISYCDVVADGVTDMGSTINACIANASQYSKITLPSGRINIGTTTIQFPLGKHYITLEGSGSNATVLLSDQNITAIKVGTYTYSGVDNWSDSNHILYGINIKNITIYNNYVGGGNATIGIDLRGLHNGSVEGVDCNGVRECLAVNPSNHWNTISNIRAYGNVLENTIRIQGDGYTNNYNSTGNIYSRIVGEGVKNAIIYATGCTFGDSVISDVNGVGVSSGGNGLLGGAVAAVYLNSNGTNCGDNLTRYASRISISNVDFDGVGDYVVRGKYTEDVKVGAFVQGGGITNGVSFDSNSVKSYQTLFTKPEYFMIDTSGNLGIGTTSPTAKITLQQNGDASSGGLRIVKTGGIVNGYWDQWIDSSNYFNFGWMGGATSKMVLGSDGNMGIGTSTPGSKLDIYQNTITSDIDLFRVISDVGGANNVKFKIDSDGDIFTDGGTTIGSPADIAENYGSEEVILPGTVVSFATTTAEWKLSENKNASIDYQMSQVKKAYFGEKVFGVVSTRPGILLGGNTHNGIPIALSGRVPVLVTQENGVVQRGDYLTLSTSTPGYAMKMTENGMSIGKALSDASSIFSTSTILILVENNNHHIITFSNTEGLTMLSLATSSSIAKTTSVASTIVDMLSHGVDLINSLVVIKISAALAYIDTIFAKEVHAEIICVKKSNGNESCFNGDQLDSLLLNTNQVQGVPFVVTVPDTSISSSNNATSTLNGSISATGTSTEILIATSSVETSSSNTVTTDSTSTVNTFIENQTQSTSSLP